ncbi:unnamed protein product [Rhizoctonia solani]|nr:unnamed protein product [Rhizoctonia solani]
MLEAELAQLKGHPTSIESDQAPFTPLDNNLVFPPDQVELLTAEQRPEPPSLQRTATAMYRYVFDIDASIPASEQPKDVQLSAACQWNRYLPQIPQLTRLEHDTILSRCFKYGVTWLHCMLPETFLHDMLYCLTSEASTAGDQLRLQHYTPMLHCALLAYGSAFSDNPELRSPALRAEFARYAKQWLDYEFERPVMGLVRALALLAEYHCGIGEWGAGYMYMGMSIRATQFYKVMALECKQLYELRVPHCGVSLPSIDMELDNQPWSDGLAGSPPRLITKTFYDSCKLMVISATVIELLYGKHQVIPDEQSVINIHLQLDTWFNNLPRELLVWARSTSPLPHLITLHIYYWFLIICLHQPFYDQSSTTEGDSKGSSGSRGNTPGQAGGGGSMHDRSRVIKMVNRATQKIVQLLQMFEEQHSMMFFPRNMIHVIYECGIVLLKDAMTAPLAATKKRANVFEAVSVCLRALRGTSKTWPWADRLANQLEGNLNEIRANNTAQPFISGWPIQGENDQSGQTPHPPVQVWDPTGLGSSFGSGFMHYFSGMQIDPPGGMQSTSQLGLDLSLHQRHGLSNLVTLVNLGGVGQSADVVGTEAGAHDAMPFRGAPSSSTVSYSLA